MTVSQITTQLRPSQQPRLPAAPVEYDRTYIDSTLSILRQYFNQIDNYTQSSLTNTGGRFLRTVCGSFQDSTTQTTTANTATAMTFNTTDTTATNSISIVSNSRIKVVYPGIYNLQFSAQFQNTDNASHDVSIWLRQNGVDVVGSSGIVGMSPRYSAGNYFHTIAGWNYLVSMAASDYLELYWSTDNAAVTLQAYAAGVTPTRPTTASVIATMSFVSAPLT
jgi:hypothetical protein